MAQELKARGLAFELHYSGRTATEMAYRDRLAIEFPGQLHQYFTRTPGGTRIDLDSIMRAAPAEARFYVCGPGRLIEAVSAAARKLAIAAGRVQYESFE
jgi:ferredoxin-NADP reductase